MMQQTKEFLSILFDPHESVCFGATAYDTAVTLVTDAPQTQYVALNPLHSRRLDANVVAYRNILVELDEGTIDEQVEALTASGIPASVITHSGGKSLHCIISLQQPLLTRIDYDNMVQAVYAAFKSPIDTSCKNPSRFTRLAGAIRPSNGVTQELLMANGRIDNGAVVAWVVGRLGALQATKLLYGWRPLKSVMAPKRAENGKAELTLRSKQFLETKSSQQGWRNEAFFFCCDAARSGYEVDEIRDMLEAVDGYLESDSERIPMDAYNKVAAAGDLGIKLLDIDDEVG
jgi:hypothetical protein